MDDDFLNLTNLNARAPDCLCSAKAQTMRALLSTAPGGPETLVLRDVPEPTPGPREVRVRVASCAVNYPDVLIIDDRYQTKPERPFSPGGEVAGIVDAIGAEVKEVRIGDRVMGFTGYGGMAEKVNLAIDNCTVVPQGMPLDEGSALLLAYATTIHALQDRAHLAQGETLLVLGAAGGVGLAAVELGKAMGARVIAVASSGEKVDLALKRGADAGIVGPRGPLDKSSARTFTDLLKGACGSPGADVIFDPVGGDYAEPALRAIGWEGRYLVVGFTAGIPRMPLNLALLKSCQIVGVFWGAFAGRDPTHNRANIDTLLDLYRRGRIKPFISERLPLERAGEAIARLAQRRALGKIVVMVS